MLDTPKREGRPMQHWGEIRSVFRLLNWLCGSEWMRTVCFDSAKRKVDEMYANLPKEVAKMFPTRERVLEMVEYSERAVNKYMCHSYIGAKGAEMFASRNVMKVSWGLEFFKRFPSAFEKKIEKPIIILGLHRTGSTLLQRLLSLDPNANEMNLWKIVADPLQDTYETACNTVRSQFTMDALSPALQSMAQEFHPMEPDFPDEDVMATYAFFSLPEYYIYNYPVDGEEVQRFLNDARQQADSLLYVRRWLQMWSVAENPLVKPRETEAGRHWVVKNPSHGYAIDELVKQFPDARLVFTHRKFEDLLKSWEGLKTACLVAVTEPSKFDSHEAGKNVAEVERLLAQRTMEFVKANPDRDDFHVTHKTIMSDPVGTVRKIYAQFGMPFTDEYRGILEDFVETSPPIPSKVKKCLSHYGLAPEDFAADTVVQEYNEMFVETQE